MLLKIEIEVHVNKFTEENATGLKNMLHGGHKKLVNDLLLTRYEPILSSIKTSIVI